MPGKPLSLNGLQSRRGDVVMSMIAAPN